MALRSSGMLLTYRCGDALWRFAAHCDPGAFSEYRTFRSVCMINCRTLPFFALLFVEQILIIKLTRFSNFSNIFWYRTLHVSDRFSVHHQESSTVYTAIGMCHTDYADCLQSADIPIAVYTVLDSWWWTENLSEICRVLYQNKFEKLVHLVGFIIRIYHYAWSSECYFFDPTQYKLLHFLFIPYYLGIS